MEKKFLSLTENIKLNYFSDDADFTESRQKISIRQLMILFLCSFLTDMTRISANIGLESISKVKYLSVFFTLIPVLLLVFIINILTRKHMEKSLSEIIEMIFGKFAGKIILSAYYIFTLFLVAYYIRNFAEKFTFSVFTQTGILIFAIPVLLFAVFIARKNLESFARFVEFIFILIVFVIIITFFICLFNIEPKNLYPATASDLPAILKNSVPLTSVFSLLTLTMFLGGNTSKSENQPQIMTKYILITALISLFGTVFITGIFNAETAANMSMPFYMIFKTLNTIGLIQSFETFFVLFWVFTDFITVTYYILVMQKIKKTLFGLKKPKFFIYPSAFIIILLVLFIGKNIIELEYFYRYIINGSSLILCYILPVITLVVGKLRRLI